MELKAALFALILRFWETLHPGLSEARNAHEAADAIADVVLEDAGRAPIFGSHAEDTAAAAYWAFKEASLDKTAVGDQGLAKGLWQHHASWSELGDVHAQVRRWFELLRAGKKYCPAHPAAMTWGACRDPYVHLSELRMARVRGALAVALAESMERKP